MVGWGSVGRAARGPSPGQGEPAAAELNHGGKEGAEGGFTKLKSRAHKPRNFHFWGNGIRNTFSAQLLGAQLLGDFLHCL